jgi:hypothetical protein
VRGNRLSRAFYRDEKPEMINLPRQARDKHREALKTHAATRGVFSAGIPWPVVVILAVRKTPLFAPIYIYINDHFTKTGSGQT